MRILKERGSVLGLMRSKRKFSLLILLALFLMAVPLASAHLGTPVYSSWTTSPPTIDGVISGGEWTDATTRIFIFDMRSAPAGSHVKYLDAKFYVKNDGTNIYAAVEVFNEDYNDLNFGGMWDGLSLLFDENNNGNLELDENGEGAVTWSVHPFYTYHDLYHRASWDADALYGGTEDGAMAWTHTAPTNGSIGDYTFEMRIPLTTVPDGNAYDLAITSLPKTVGFKIWYIDRTTHGLYPDDGATANNYAESESGGTFGDLVLAGPPPAVGGIAAPITLPTDKLGLLTRLIWLASIIMFPIAVTVFFVRLKKKKQ